MIISQFKDLYKGIGMVLFECPLIGEEIFLNYNFQLKANNLIKYTKKAVQMLNLIFHIF